MIKQRIPTHFVKMRQEENTIKAKKVDSHRLIVKMLNKERTLPL